MSEVGAAIADPGVPAAVKTEDEQREQVARSKRGVAKRKPAGGGGARASGSLGFQQQAEPLPLTTQQADFVRVVKVDTRKAAAEAGEDMSRVQLSRTGKAAQLVLSEDRLSVSGTKGFRTARASHGAHVGTWYCEVRVTRLGPTGHARLGVITRKAELQAPVGFDGFGYAYRDLEGSKVHHGRREAYGEAFGEGDVIGILLHMPPGGKPLEAQDRNMVRFKGALYYVDEPEAKPQPLPGSYIAFTRNGVPQGPAYSDILEGTYYPAAALYTLPEQTEGALVTFNFGPNFVHPPPALLEGSAGLARPWCELTQAATVTVAAPVTVVNVPGDDVKTLAAVAAAVLAPGGAAALGATAEMVSLPPAAA